MVSENARLDEMFKRNNVAPNDYEKAKAGLEQMKTQLEMTRNKLAYTRLEAPTSGYVVERFMEEGEMAGAELQSTESLIIRDWRQLLLYRPQSIADVMKLSVAQADRLCLTTSLFRSIL